MRLLSWLAVLLTGLAAACLSQAAEWPHWRGPCWNGSSSEEGLPTTFSETEKIVWATPMSGASGATPVIWGDRVFVSSVDAEKGELLAICLSADTGKECWRHVMGRDREIVRNNMASPSPVTDGQRVLFSYGTGRLAAFKVTGEFLWERNLEKDHGHNALMFGYSSSPLLFRGTLYVQAVRNARSDRYGKAAASTASSYLLAIDPVTGKDRWLRERPTEARGEAQEAYSSPIPFRPDGDQAQILVYGADQVTAHQPTTGRQLWCWEGYNPRRINHWRIIPSPVAGEDLVYIFGPKHSTMFALRPEIGNGEVGGAQVAWTFDKYIPDASTPLLYRGRLYVLDDDRKIMSCFDPQNGTRKWELQVGGRHVMRASPLGASGRVYCINGAGEVTVLEAGDAPKILHRTRLGDQMLCRSSIAAAGGRLFVRTTGTLFCFAEGGRSHR